MSTEDKTHHLKQFVDFLSSDPNEYFTTLKEQEIYESHHQQITDSLNEIIDLVFYDDQPNEQDRLNFQYLVLNRFLDVLRESEADTDETSKHISDTPCNLFNDTITSWTPSS